VADDADKCLGVVGVAPDGCPPDADGDMVPDATDVCPNEPGFGSKDATKNGCPPPLADCDHDGTPDQADKCPDLAGDGPDGCILDTDADGVRDTEDKCATEAETKNAFEDTDGCPDEVSEAVKQLSGVLAGVEFDAKANLKPSSSAALDGVVKTLTENPTLRVQVSAHTDNAGKPEANQKLSAERAEAVKAYLVSKGVTDGRVETLGAGDTAPIGDNATKEGRAQNRRVELKLLP
jgi:OOP family OmpA-OmpF porin